MTKNYRDPRPIVAASARRLFDGYRGPIVRVRLSNEREVDVYDDDPAIEVPGDALRYAQLESEGGGEDVHVLFYYNQVT